MTPKETLYRLCQLSDVRVVEKIWRDQKKQFGRPKKLGWPTVVAERNGKILGFLATQADNPQEIIAAPLIVNGGSSPFTAMRLVQAYENVLKFAGVTAYYFHVEKKNEKWLKIVRELNQMGIAEERNKDRTGFWFRRNLSRTIR